MNKTIFELETKEIKEIVNKYNNGKRDLFNWCEPYKKFVSSSILYNVSSEWDYMLSRSHEDTESPVSYDDLPLSVFDEESLTNAKHDLKEQIKKDCEEVDQKDLLESLEEVEDVNELYSFCDCNNLDFDEDDYKRDVDIYEWWLVDSQFRRLLQQEEEIFLNEAWGRQTTGQSIALDSCVINAFISLCLEILNYRKE